MLPNLLRDFIYIRTLNKDPDRPLVIARDDRGAGQIVGHAVLRGEGGEQPARLNAPPHALARDEYRVRDGVRIGFRDLEGFVAADLVVPVEIGDVEP